MSIFLQLYFLKEHAWFPCVKSLLVHMRYACVKSLLVHMSYTYLDRSC